MKRLITLISICVLFNTVVSSQYLQEFYKNWYFGQYAGIRFNPDDNVEVLTNSQLNSIEACSSISKGTDLCFYTDGVTVWNRYHHPMPNGTGLMANASSAQGALAIPAPHQSNKYYIFTTADNEHWLQNGLRYSLVDMTLDGFDGDVTEQKNVLLEEMVTEKLAVVPHSNGVDLWVIAIRWESNTFLAYLVTQDGVNPQPVESSAGTFFYTYSPPSPSGYECAKSVGYLKASPDGTKLATILHDEKKVEFYDFDRATGIVSNPRTSPALYNFPYGVAFSPNSRFLYVSTVYSNSKIYQFDTEDPNCFSQVLTIASGGSIQYFALELAPDGKIYVAQHQSSTQSNYLSIISKPDLLGADCLFSQSALYLGGKLCQRGLPQMYYFKPNPTITVEDTYRKKYCNIFPNPANSLEYVTFYLPDNKACSVDLISSDGRKIFSWNFEAFSNTAKLQLPAVAPGLYFLHFNQGEEQYTKKLLIK